MTHEPGTECGCAEYEALERRQLLDAVWRMGALAMVSAPAWFPKLAFANNNVNSAPSRDLLVVIFLRGGADGLTFCAPFADPYYASSRANLAVPPPDSSAPRRAINLDGFFGLPPGLARLKPIYDAGHLAIVHAVGNPMGVRSHFYDQDLVELATPIVANNSTGWLSRHLLATAAGVPADRLRALSAGFSLTRALTGAPAAVAMSSDGNYGLSGWTGSATERRTFLNDAYRRAGDQFTAHAGYILSSLNVLSSNTSIVTNVTHSTSGDAGGQPVLFDSGFSGEALRAINSTLSTDPTDPSDPLVEYPADGWGRALRSVAQLAHADVGLEIASIDFGGWDTHASQGTLEGTLNNLMTHFAKGIEAFYHDMADRLSSTTVVVMSEFGRRVASNDSGGCDHGRGGVMLVLGGNVNGGRVFTQWPGLHPDQLNQRLDLAITTDYRDVLSEILVRRAGSNSLSTVFPGYTPNFRGIVR